MSATTSIPAAAELLGISRNLAYALAARDGELVGVTVLVVGRRRLLPTAPLLEALGLESANGHSDDPPE
jgi:hypothetical protein